MKKIVWCEHIQLSSTGLTWGYSSGDFLDGGCIREPEKQFVLWFWKFCPLCGKPRPKKTKGA